VTPTLTTLIADLVGETAEGVREASIAAARRRTSLHDGLTAEPSEADVDGALASLFPPLARPPVDLLARVLDREALDEYVSTWRPGRTSVRAGEVYLHPGLVEADDAKARIAEFPPIERELGVSVLETVERGEGVGRLTEASVALVRRTLRARIEAERRTAVAAFADGVPTPVVETATVEVKAAFGGEERIEATLLDGRDGTVDPGVVGTITADLRFLSLPYGEDHDDGRGGDDDGRGGDGRGDGHDGDPDPDGRDRNERPGPREPLDPGRPASGRSFDPGRPFRRAVTRVDERSDPDLDVRDGPDEPADGDRG
jgi:hypothetical protein